MKKLLFLLLGLSSNTFAAGAIIGYVQISTNSIPLQPGAFNTSSGTVGTLNVSGLSPSQCVQTGASGQLTTTGVPCGSGIVSGPSSGTITASAQNNVPFYSVSGTSNVLSGVSAFQFNGTSVTVNGITANTSMSAPIYSLTNGAGDVQSINGGVGLFSTQDIYLNPGSGNSDVIAQGSKLGFVSGSGDGRVTLISSNSVTPSITFTLPNKDGSSGQGIITDGSGHLSFAGIGSSSSLQISTSGVQITSPTNSINFYGGDFGASSVGTTAQIVLNPSTTDFIHNQITPQTANFNITSGTVNTQLTINGGRLSLKNIGDIDYGTNSPLYIMDIRGNASNSDPTPLVYFQYSGNGTALEASGDNASPAALFFNNSTGDAVKASKIGGSGIAGEFTTDSSTALYANSTSGIASRFNSSSGNAIQVDNGPVIGKQFSFLGPTQSTVTYGLTVGSMTVNGSSAGAISLNEGLAASAFTPASGKDIFWADQSSHSISGTFNGSASTYTFITSSITPVVGQCAQWTSTGPNSWTQGTVACGGGGGGTPATPFNSVQYNNAGAFGGSNNFQWNGTSITVLSSMSITNAGGTDAFANPAILEIWGSGGLGLTTDASLFKVGGSATVALFNIRYNDVVDMSGSGSRIGNLQIGGRADGDAVGDAYSLNELSNTGSGQGIKLWNTGNIDLFTASPGLGGTNGNINFIIGRTAVNDTSGGTTEMVISSFGITDSTSTLVGPGTVSSTTEMDVIGSTISATYSLRVSSLGALGSNTFSLAVSTSGHVVSNGPTPIISACGSGPNGSVVGDDYQGTITIGGGSVTGCTLTFSQTFGTGCTVNCTTSDSITTTTPDVATTPTTMTLGFSASIGGGKVLYHCTGYGPTCR
jgi:hypothetical protein